MNISRKERKEEKREGRVERKGDLAESAHLSKRLITMSKHIHKRTHTRLLCESYKMCNLVHCKETKNVQEIVKVRHPQISDDLHNHFFAKLDK